jgi:TolB-like protein/tetratricopeptide (TPR) repeat protein
MASVFLSYSRQDQVLARKLVAALESNGCTVWWDGLLDGGDRYSRTTAAELSKAEVVVVLWSKASVDSHWVHDEAGAGRDRGRMVPITIDGTLPPLGFRQFQQIDFSKWKGKIRAPEMAQLTHAIRTVSGNAEIVRPTAVAPSTNRRALVFGAASLAVIGGGGLAAWRQGWLAKPPGLNSIAVLPFRNLSGESSQDYFAEGLAEETRLALARNPQLTVTATTSSSVFRNTTDSVVAIAAKLGVLFILEGSVQRAGELVRIGLKLIDGKSGETGWFKSLELAFSNIFSLQDIVSNAVADALTAQVSGEGALTTRATVAESGGTNSAAAFDAFMKGRSSYNSYGGGDSITAAMKHFENAIASDANYAAAHANRSKCLVDYSGGYAAARDVPSLNREAVAAARRAVLLAPKYADGHSALGFALLADKLSLAEARKPYALSRELGWGNASALLDFARFNCFDGDFAQAFKASERALILDPLNARSQSAHCRVLFSSRQYAQTAIAARKTIAQFPEVVGIYTFLGRALMLQGDVKGGIEASQKEPLDYCRTTDLAIMNFRLGNQAVARKALEDLQQIEQTHYQQAEVLAQWGDADGALAHLDQAFSQGDLGVVEVGTNVLLDPIRNHVRFQAFMQRIGYRT